MCHLTDHIVVLVMCIAEDMKHWHGVSASVLMSVSMSCCAYTHSNSQSGSVAEWLACWTQAQKGPGSNRSCDAVG